MSRHALVLPKEEWGRIQDHLQKKTVVPEEAMRSAYLDYMNRLNKTLTADWKDSAENKIKQYEKKFSTALIDEKRVVWKKAAERVAEENEVRRTAAVERAKEMLFRQSDDCKSFQRAFYQTKSNHWVESQRKLNARIKQEKKDIKDAYEEKLLEECDAWKKKEMQKIARKRLINLENKAELMKQIDERKNIFQNDQTKTHESEILLCQGIRREIEIERRNLLEKKAKDRECLVNALDEGVREKNRKRATDVKISDVTDQINEIYNDYSHKFECLKDRKIKKVILERRDKQNSLAEKLGAFHVANEKKCQEYVDKSIERYKKKCDKEALKDPAKLAAIRAERREIEADFMKPLDEQRRVKERKEKKEAITNWGMANNLKNAEKFKMNDFKDRKAEQKLHWDSVTEQVDFKKKKREQLEAEWKAYENERKALSEAQTKKLLDYAFDVVCECKAGNRTTLPLMRFIAKYKKENGYIPLPPIPAKEMSHFPGYERPPDKRYYGLDKDCLADEMAGPRVSQSTEHQEEEKPRPPYHPAVYTNDPKNGLQKLAGPDDVGCDFENILN